MEFKKLSKSLKIPVLGIGTAGMGGEHKKDISKDKLCIQIIKTAIKMGITHIDTAELYGAGHSEEIVGKAIKGENRKKLFITTKVWKDNLRYDDVINSANNSLKRLGVNYIDLYLIHRLNRKIPLRETMNAMDYLVKKNKIKFIGVSNFSVKKLNKAQSYLKHKIVVNQIEYNLLKRSPEKNLLNYCQKNNILIIAYQPFAGGKLTKPGFKMLDDLGKKYKKTPAQIAINWLVSKPNIITIPKTTSISHLKENLGALGWKIEKKDVQKLENYFYFKGIFFSFVKKTDLIFKTVLYMVTSFNQRQKLKKIYYKILNLIHKFGEKF